MSDPSGDVSRIHKRYALTLFSPSSFYTSLIISAIVVSFLVATTYFGNIQTDDLVFRWGAVIAVLLATQYLDSRLIKNKEYSKALHMSLFGNSLWLLTVAVGLASIAFFSKQDAVGETLFYITEGMFLFASFRIGIFTTTLGVSLRKAWALCFIQPLAIFLVMVPQGMWLDALTNPVALGIGFAFMAIASGWSAMTDRAGRPGVQSTHRLVQAYLSSKSFTDPTEMESIIGQQSRPSRVSTSQIRFHKKGRDEDFRLVLPDLHPGPFHPVGGSNIPYLIYKTMDSSAMVMHSISDHSLNLPTRQEVQNYLDSLAVDAAVRNQGVSCTEPVTVQINKARAAGLLFGKTAVLFLSLSPHGMEDLPPNIKSEIERFAKNRSFERVLIVDSHNAMGSEISQTDAEDLLSASKSALETLMTKQTSPLEYGYANSADMNLNAADLAMGGIGILCIRANQKKYFLGWADANNMENGVREEVVKHFADNGMNLIEVCTSDSHYTTQIVRNKNGYYQFGIVTKPTVVANWFLEVAKKAEKNIESASFEILEHQSDVKVMGRTMLRDYSKAIDNSMKITKAFVIGCAVLFLVSML